MVVRRKNKPPSRVRYEEAHPVISIRLDQDTADAVRKLCKKTGKSLGTLIKENLKVQKRDEDKTYDQAVKDYEIWYYCAKCGGKITISPNSKSHTAVIEYLKEKGWSHQTCPSNQK
jgi:hypothetical protein